MKVFCKVFVLNSVNSVLRVIFIREQVCRSFLRIPKEDDQLNLLDFCNYLDHVPVVLQLLDDKYGKISMAIGLVDATFSKNRST
jgi:hypothetical protein